MAKCFQLDRDRREESVQHPVMDLHHHSKATLVLLVVAADVSKKHRLEVVEKEAEEEKDEEAVRSDLLVNLRLSL